MEVYSSAQARTPKTKRRHRTRTHESKPHTKRQILGVCQESKACSFWGSVYCCKTLQKPASRGSRSTATKNNAQKESIKNSMKRRKQNTKKTKKQNCTHPSTNLGVRERLQLLGLRPLPQVPEQFVSQGHVEPVRQQIQQAAQPLQQRQAQLLNVRQVFQHRPEARLQQVLRHAGLVLELSVREDHLHQRRLCRIHHLLLVRGVTLSVGVSIYA